MSYARRVASQLKRFGQEATVLVHAQSGTDALNNPIDEWTERTGDPTVLAVRTYPDHNTEAKSVAGDLHTDEPRFLIPVARTEDDPDPPGDEDHLVYDGTEYALQAPTYYDTHVEFGAERVTN